MRKVMTNIMSKQLSGTIAALLFSMCAAAEAPMLQEDVPDTHTVVKGDTLWDISNSFLKNPWLWPEIWHVNAQIENPHLIYPGDVIRLIYIDGEPRLTLDNSGRIYKLEPKARVVSVGDAIDTIPLDRINTFLSRSRIVEKGELQLAPYVVGGVGDRLIAGTGDSVYVRGSDVEDNRAVYGMYRLGDKFVDPETDELLGVQARDIGTGEIMTTEGEIATMRISRTTEEVRIGDRLLREEERAVDSTFFPSAPEADIEATILAVEGGVSTVGKMDVVVLNRGSRESIEIGNVLAVYKRGNVITDRISGDKLQLPEERAGLLMVFRVFEKLSLGIVLEADQGLRVEDIVRNP